MISNIPVWVAKMVEWAKELVASFIEEFLENAPEWLQNLTEIGAWIVQKIIDGLDDNWYRLIAFIKELLKKIRDLFGGSEPKDPTSPLRGLAESGKAIADNLAKGIDFSSVRAALTTELASTQAALSSAGGGMTVYQTFGEMARTGGL
jgi:hypothetical protein